MTHVSAKTTDYARLQVSAALSTSTLRQPRSFPPRRARDAHDPSKLGNPATGLERLD